MILAVVTGLLLQVLANVPDALLWSVLGGLILAPLVPGKAGACGLPARDER